MIKVIKEGIEIEESLEFRLKIIYNSCNTTPIMNIKVSELEDYIKNN